MKKSASKQFYMHKIANFLNVQKIVTIHYQKPERNYVSIEESHNFWELLYADKEEFYIHRADEVVLLKQGEIFFIEPKVPHYVESKGKEANIFIVSFECRSESISFFAGKRYSVPQEMKYLLEHISFKLKSSGRVAAYNGE